MTRLDIVGSFSGHAGPRRLCERYPSSHCEVTTPPDAGYCDAGGCPLGIDKVGASDGDLVRRVLAGDTGAYAALVARYRDRLGRYAVHMLGDRQDAEEALQDAFVRAYRSLARCDDPERFGAWLYGILVNRCRTTGGRAARRARLFVRNDAALSGVALPSPAERAEWDDTVRRALARLAPEYREAFLLKHVEELEYEEMAQLTGAGISALKMRVKRAREQLQVIFREAERV
ncbi:MAG: RNA polymerase subunit sigma-24 [Gemmatimonadetes bacterium]|nr:MAG: RNA polymerase subunit sigma-24 [Gemmatimonadota bacterium]PYP29018.1 MAG: RNA polymerase subunit sigma-24 [Gemmatimonadota bacterium]